MPVLMIFSFYPMIKWQGRIEPGRKTRDADQNKVESGRCHVVSEGVTCHNITDKPQQYGDTHIIINGLI